MVKAAASKVQADKGHLGHKLTKSKNIKVSRKVRTLSRARRGGERGRPTREKFSRDRGRHGLVAVLSFTRAIISTPVVELVASKEKRRFNSNRSRWGLFILTGHDLPELNYEYWRKRGEGGDVEAMGGAVCTLHVGRGTSRTRGGSGSRFLSEGMKGLNVHLRRDKRSPNRREKRHGSKRELKQR